MPSKGSYKLVMPIKVELLIFSLMSQHGRIKVRTTAEQAEAKRKEREKKLKIYQQTTNRIYEKVYFTTSEVLN